VLDTSVLIHDPDALYSFEEHDLVLPYVVVHEVDGLRRAPNGRGAAASQVVRHLEELRLKQPTLRDIPLNEQGGRLSVYMPSDIALPPAEDVPKSLRDDLLIACARDLAATHPEVIIVSKDIGLRVKASAHGLAAQDYRRSRIERADERYTGLRAEPVVIPAEYGQRLHEDTVDAPEGLLENEFCYVVLEGMEQTGRHLCRHKRGKLHLVPTKWRSIQGIKPLDDCQRMAFDVLLDEEIRCVALLGVAGGGKTLLALAAGLEFTESKDYESIVAIKPVIPVGRRDIGYLKGDKDEKLYSWLMPVFDNLRVLQMYRKRPLDAEMLRESGQLQMESMTYLRGRTLHGYWVILDEMQNTTPLETTTALSRIGERTKCILLADLTQIDNPYVDAQSCGATFAVNRLQNHPMFAVVPMTVSQRSEFAQLVADRMRVGQPAVP
jgi:PhoH-like ATPase